MDDTTKISRPELIQDGFEMPNDGALAGVFDSSSQGEREWSWESLNQCRHLWNSLPLGIGLLIEGRFAYFNRPLEAIFRGSNEADLMDRSFLDFVSEESLEPVKVSMDTAQNAATAVPIGDVTIVRPDGTSFPAHCSVSAARFAGRQAILVIVSGASPVLSSPSDAVRPDRKAQIISDTIRRLLRKIDDVSQECDGLRRRGELLHAIVNGTQDLVFAKDVNQKYILVNPAMEKLHARQASRFVGFTAEDIMPGDNAVRIKALDRRVLAGETIEETYNTLIRGTRLTFHGIRMPLKDVTGKVIGLFGIVRNITEPTGIKTLGPSLMKGGYPSKAMQKTLAYAKSVAATDGTVLFAGESGSGKDYLARWIHDHSKRSDGPFFSINCAAVSGEIADSELFGHEAGAFTGARTAKRGLLQLAEGGTLLLNEIGEFSIPLQAKLLTFLDTKSFLRVGGEQVIHVDVRIMAATHRVLTNEVAEGRFLSALFYRLNVLRVDVPPLRDRAEDVPMMAREIVGSLAKEMQMETLPEIDPASLCAMTRYHWPGNVRELKNVLERALMLWRGGSLRTDINFPDMSSEPWSHRVSFDSEMSLNGILEEVTEALCTEAVRRCNGNKTDAARLLGISRGALYRNMKRAVVSR